MDKTATTIIDLSSLAAGATSTLADCTAVDLARTVTVTFAAQATFNASATGGLTIKFYPSTDNSTYDDDAYVTWDVACHAGETWQEHYYSIDPSKMYYKVTVTNEDSTYAVTNLKIICIQTEL